MKRYSVLNSPEKKIILLIRKAFSLLIRWQGQEGERKIREGHSPLKRTLLIGKCSKYCFQFSIKLNWEIWNLPIKAKTFTKNTSTRSLRKINKGAIHVDMQSVRGMIPIVDSINSNRTKFFRAKADFLISVLGPILCSGLWNPRG